MSELLTIPEAATVAGVSERTMRRWASSGHVRTVVTGHVRRIVAGSLPESPATNGHDPDRDRPAADTETVSGHEADRLADLVRELTGRLAEQTALTAIWQERARVLGDQLALTAPESLQDASGATETPDPTTDAPVPRWRRWWRVLWW